MRHYIIFDKTPTHVSQIMEIFEEVNDFDCLAVLRSPKDPLHHHLQFTPELVVINLDDFESNILEILTKIKKTFGLLPNLIGITDSYKSAYEAMKMGFLEVIGPDMELASLRSFLLEYRSKAIRSFFCIPSYKDFHYVDLENLILLRADDRTTDFILKDGKRISGLNTLKHYSQQLPLNYVRVHRSFIVNAHAVRRINYLKKQILLAQSSEYIPFTKYYLDNVDCLKKILADC